MATPFETFVNTELPKRVSIPVPDGGNLPAGKVLTTTGIGVTVTGGAVATGFGYTGGHAIKK